MPFPLIVHEEGQAPAPTRLFPGLRSGGAAAGYEREDVPSFTRNGSPLASLSSTSKSVIEMPASASNVIENVSALFGDTQTVIHGAEKDDAIEEISQTKTVLLDPPEDAVETTALRTTHFQPAPASADPPEIPASIAPSYVKPVNGLTPPAGSLADRLAQACLTGKLKQVSQLLDEGADPNATGQVTTEDGTVFGDLLPLQAALFATDSDDVTPKMLRKQTARIVKALLSRGALTTDIERDLVMHCANNDLAEVIEVLGEQNIRLRRYGFDVMGIAMTHGNVDVMKAMTKFGCSVNIQNDRGNRPFLDLCSKTLRSPVIRRGTPGRKVEEWTQLIGQYMDVGLNIEATDKVGCTALMRAVATGNETLAWALLASGANPKAMLPNGVSVTHLAAACMGADFLRRYLSMTGAYTDLVRLRARRLQPDVRAMVEAAAV